MLVTAPSRCRQTGRPGREDRNIESLLRATRAPVGFHPSPTALCSVPASPSFATFLLTTPSPRIGRLQTSHQAARQPRWSLRCVPTRQRCHGQLRIVGVRATARTLFLPSASPRPSHSGGRQSANCWQHRAGSPGSYRLVRGPTRSRRSSALGLRCHPGHALVRASKPRSQLEISNYYST